MAVDGTYGRLGTHNQRMKTLRRRRNSDGGYNFLHLVKVQHVAFDEVDPESLQKVKKDIKHRRKIEFRKDIIAACLSFVVSLVTFYFFVDVLSG